LNYSIVAPLALHVLVKEQNASAVRSGTKEEEVICSSEIQSTSCHAKNNGIVLESSVIVQRVDYDEGYKKDDYDSHNDHVGVSSDLRKRDAIRYNIKKNDAEIKEILDLGGNEGSNRESDLGIVTLATMEQEDIYDEEDVVSKHDRQRKNPWKMKTNKIYIYAATRASVKAKTGNSGDALRSRYSLTSRNQNTPIRIKTTKTMQLMISCPRSTELPLKSQTLAITSEY
jgi:hypothetical protein